MAKLSESVLRRLIKTGETNTVELKVAAPGATEMAERLCGIANAQKNASSQFKSCLRHLLYR